MTTITLNGMVEAYEVADNRLTELGPWDTGKLVGELESLKLSGYEIDLTGYSLTDLGRMRPPDKDADKVPEALVQAVTQPGDLWRLGQHRVICGDATDPDTIKRLYDGGQPTLMLTDPPYCSGGWQEAGKARGSVGTDSEHKKVHNDTLSTRGYTALMERAIRRAGVLYAYMFTDWRMWVTLFDIAESCGLGVRQMIVWDKGSPGMGIGWRAQHELIMFASSSDHHFDRHRGYGNVVASARTGNKHHTTEKPVDLLEKIIENMGWCPEVVDPFLGSGSTLIAAERQERTCFGVELDAAYVDVVVERWQDYTGGKAERSAAS